ncbi:hypothetical protein [Streptomyces longwoodensis]|uniref:hypothetical protein n=1 Tax=Streptomyces longwoodensis TaxID=68231 RepID=UPI0033EB456E
MKPSLRATARALPATALGAALLLSAAGPAPAAPPARPAAAGEGHPQPGLPAALGTVR